MTRLDLEELTLSEACAQIQRRELSPVDLTSGCLERIGKLNPALNAYVTITEERALADARAAEEENDDAQ